MRDAPPYRQRCWAPGPVRRVTAGFVDRYRRAVSAYQDQLAEKRRRREDAKRRQALKALS